MKKVISTLWSPGAGLENYAVSIFRRFGVASLLQTPINPGDEDLPDYLKIASSFLGGQKTQAMGICYHEVCLSIDRIHSQ